MQKQYENRLVIKLSQSSRRIVILCRGEAVEPQIEFDRPLVEFSPILPHSPADEKEFIVHNPCKFPVEIYNLEFDKIYLEEEKVRLLIEAKHILNIFLILHLFFHIGHILYCVSYLCTKHKAHKTIFKSI